MTTTKPATVHATRPKCPYCDCDRLLAYRTTKYSDGAVLRRCKCAGCGRKVHVVWE